MSQEVKITKQNFESIVTTSEKPVLLDFWATWCGPCMMISPIIKEIAEENPQYLIGKINVDEEPELAASFGIESIPTLIIIKNGAITRRVSGARPKAAILSLLSE